MTRNRTLPVALLATVAMLAACATPTPSATPSASKPPPAPTVVRPTPIAGPVTDRTIDDAAAVLDSLDSYRFVQHLAQGSSPAIELRGTVVNGSEPRTRTDQVVGGQVTSSIVTIGSRTWMSLAGSAFHEQDAGGEPRTDAWTNPIAGLLEIGPDGLGAAEDVGLEARPDGPARHIRATVAPPAPDEDLGVPGMEGYAGVADVWIDAARGHVVEARFTGTQPGMAWGEEDAEPTPSPTPYSFDVVIEGIDDSTNVVEEPSAPVPTVLPSGDPAAAALVAGIPAGLDTLDSYVMDVRSEMSGVTMTSTLTVVNRPVPAAMTETDTGTEGFPGLDILVVGDQAWARSGDAPWDNSDGGPTCGRTGSTEDMEPCTFELLTDGVQISPDVAGTFTVAATDEVVGGVPTTRLRSEAGFFAGSMTIPGVTDVWVANEGGYLVRQVFTGAGLRSTSDITRVNDPTIVIEPPAG